MVSQNLFIILYQFNPIQDNNTQDDFTLGMFTQGNFVRESFSKMLVYPPCVTQNNFTQTS